MEWKEGMEGRNGRKDWKEGTNEKREVLKKGGEGRW